MPGLRSRIEFLQSPALWQRVVQIFVGLFFVAAAYEKIVDSFFGLRSSTMQATMQYWLDQGYPVSWYGAFLTAAMPYADLLGSLVIVAQAVAGILLIYGWKTRFAGAILLAFELSVFLGTFHNLWFHVLLGMTAWISLYYVLRPRMTPGIWTIMTLAMVAVGALHVALRFTQGDPWLSAFPGRFQYFQSFVMGSSPELKRLATWMLSGPKGAFLWAACWWLQVIILLFMLTRYRLWVAALWMVLAIVRALLWLNVMNPDAVLWVLMLFVWMTEEVTRTEGGLSVPILSPLRETPLGRATMRIVESVDWKTVQRRTANAFFACMSAAIVAALVVPSVFGLQQATQWGGMYTDGWCRASVYPGNPQSNPATASEWVTSGTDAPQVWSPPMHNADMCAMWVKRIQCGRVTKDGWTVSFAQAHFKGGYLLDGANICEINFPTSYDWFRNARS